MKDGATLRSSPPWHVLAAETQVRSRVEPVRSPWKRQALTHRIRSAFFSFKVLGIGALSASLTASATSFKS